MPWTTFCSISCDPLRQSEAAGDAAVRCPERIPPRVGASPDRRGAVLLCCAVIRKKGIESQAATTPCVSLLFYFVKEDETQRKGKLRFYAIPLKIFIRPAGLGGRASCGHHVLCCLLAGLPGGGSVPSVKEIEWHFF